MLQRTRLQTGEKGWPSPNPVCDAAVVDMHRGQLSVPPATVRRLIGEQFPQWKHLPVRPVPSPGTVNAIFRIGDEFVARFPLLAGDGAEEVHAHLLAEVAAAQELAGRTRFDTPRPVAVGVPGSGYPLPWLVNTWLPGVPATADSHRDSRSFAEDVGDFIHALRSMDTRGRAYNGDGRGGDLLSHDEWMQECLARSEELLDVATLRAVWADMRDLPRGDSPDVMSHCDLIPPNVLYAEEHLVGVLDVGALGAADPALDLVSAWHLFDTEPRGVLRARLGSEDAEWERGRAWAFEQAMGVVWYYVQSSPGMSAGCRRTLERIVADIRS